VIPTIRIHGVPEALRAFDQLPRRVRFKHLRIALNAGGGVIRDRYKAIAHKETGLLSKSIGVKVKIPDASFNSAHHGKPAYAVVGVKRKAGRMMRLNKKGNLKVFGKAQQFLVAERKRLNKEGKLPPLRREHAAKVATLNKFQDVVYRNPARYAHLAGPRRKGAEVLASAVRASKSQAIARVSEKLRQGIEIEARSLAGAGA
jgi:hypothetical protein